MVTLIWGTTFVATRRLVAGEEAALAPSAATFWRFLIASIAFWPFVRHVKLSPSLLRIGLELSFWLWCGYATQALGLKYTTVNKSAFITSLNVIFVPLLTRATGRRVGWVIGSAAGLALCGVALLSYDGTPPNQGDVWTLACAITFAVYILRLEHFTARIEARALTAVQLWGVALFSFFWAAGDVATGAGWGHWTPGIAVSILYLGLIATLLTTWLQTIGQQSVPGTHASLLYTTEPVFASFFAYLLFGEMLGTAGIAGAVLILIAAIYSQAWPMLQNRRSALAAKMSISRT